MITWWHRCRCAAGSTGRPQAASICGRPVDGDFPLALEDPRAEILGGIALRESRTVANSAPNALRRPTGDVLVEAESTARRAVDGRGMARVRLVDWQGDLSTL